MNRFCVDLNQSLFNTYCVNICRLTFLFYTASGALLLDVGRGSKQLVSTLKRTKEGGQPLSLIALFNTSFSPRITTREDQLSEIDRETTQFTFKLMVVPISAKL